MYMNFSEGVDFPSEVRSVDNEVRSVDNEVLLQNNNGRRLKFCVYVDTAAAKSVMCTEMKNAIVKECVRRNWPYRVVEENEPFRFGPGKRIWSKQALIIAANWGRSCGNFATVGDRPQYTNSAQ